MKLVSENLRALGSTSFGLPIVIAGADLLVAIETRGHTQALSATLLTEEHAWLVVLSLGAPPAARVWALCTPPTHSNFKDGKKKKTVKLCFGGFGM